MVDSDAQRIEKAIRKIQESGDESDLIDVLLQGALNWPLNHEEDEDIEIDDISYSWDDVLVEMGFSSADAPIELRQVMPFPNWPHGIFIVKFGSSKFFTQNRGMTRPLRKILRELMENVRPTADHPSWKKEHLLFLCHSETKYFEFARFEDPKDDSKTAKLQMFGWGPNDHIRTVCEHNLTNLIYKQGMNEEEATETVASAFDVSKVSKEFYEDYKKAFENAKPIIAEHSSITDANEIHQTTQTLFNRILFLRFIEKKGWLHFGETNDYLRELFKAGGVGPSTFYSSRLKRLFFEGLAIEGKQNEPTIYGEVAFLNGGLFEESKYDKTISDLPDEMFEPLLGEHGMINNYNFTVQESTPLDIVAAIDPEMIGTMFEALVTDRGGKGAFYTPRVVVAYMCREAIKSVLEERTEVNAESIRKLVDDDDKAGLSIDDALIINSVLAEVKAIDPACGSGAYLLGLLHELVRVLTKLSTTAEDLTENHHKMKLRIISRSIYGVDLDPFATNIAMLRLWLSLSVEAPEPLPLPNLDFNIETGDSLLAPDPQSYQMSILNLGLLQRADALSERKEIYLKATGDNARELRAEIKAEEAGIRKMLRNQNDEIGSVDYRVHFASVFTKNGGFDIVLANPPYVRQEDLNACFKKKLFANYSAGVAESGLVKRSDLYCYFYVRASQLLRGNGVMAFICSNSWLDVDFGKPLKKFLKNNQHLVSIIDSSKERQFVSAAVNTIISVSKKVSGHSKGTKFINLQGGFEDSISNPEMRTECLVEFDNLDPEEKWLLFTKAPEIYFQALEGGLFQGLENFGLITRGFTSGANDFFFIPKGTRPEIESRFLKPVIKTPREVTGIMVNEEMLANEVFLCQPPKRILKNEFPGAHAYVKEGEEKIIEIKRGKDKGTELVGYNSLSTTKSRPQWYTLPKLKRADVLLRQFYNDKFDFPLNPLGLPCDHTFYYIHLPAEAEGCAHTEYSESDHQMKILRLGAYLNSSISWMFVEVLGRKNMGEGVLTCYGPEMRPFPTLDPNRLEGIEDLFKPLTKRPVESVFKELGLDPELPISGQTPNPKPDRKALDDFVFDIVGLDEEQRTQVYLSLCEMVQNRLSKAKTIL